MIEIFEDISEEIRQTVEIIFNKALETKNAVKMVEILDNYTNNCKTDREKEFSRFYFNLRMEQMFNESNNAEREKLFR